MHTPLGLYQIKLCHFCFIYSFINWPTYFRKRGKIISSGITDDFFVIFISEAIIFFVSMLRQLQRDFILKDSLGQ